MSYTHCVCFALPKLCFLMPSEWLLAAHVYLLWKNLENTQNIYIYYIFILALKEVNQSRNRYLIFV